MKKKPISIAVAYFIAVIVLAHFFVPPLYDWTQNTVSDLASQGHTYKWIMQTGFIGFGLLLTWGVIFHFSKNRRAYFLLFVAVYGLSILMSGIFCTMPIDPSMSYSVSESKLHSMFATIAGVAMSLGIFWQVIVSLNQRERWTRIAFFVLVIGISGLFGLAENHILALDKGIVQRCLYLAGLAWLIYEEQILFKGKVNSK
ncbi:MAG: DUF998 domain-containing protein [Anaerolineales bacterium]|nr:DUF998 domain-containing protein [Anaerolineales bacterium]